MGEKYVCKLPDHILEIAKKELNEVPERRASDIEMLRQWVLKQPHLKARTDDDFLLRFLRNCKFSIERAKEKLDQYYTLKTALPEWFSGMDCKKPAIQELLKAGVFIPLGYDKQGRSLAINRMSAFDSSKYKLNDLFRLNMMIAEILLQDEQSVICGATMILDCSNTTLSQMAVFTPTVAKKSMACWQDAMPVRMKGFHYWKMPSFLETMFNLFKSFMKPKLQKRITIHGDLASLHAAIPPEILPEEYGGTAGPLQKFVDLLYDKVMEKRDFYLEDEKYKADESKRLGKPKTQEDLFGIDGTFRKLDLD